jgi:4-hydroxybenzoyl-CoA thioesterase
MFLYARPVRFEEVDPAGLLFFGRYLHYAHETMERFFDVLDGGYAALIQARGLGFPAVKTEVLHHSPLRYGDTAEVEMEVAHIGTTSCVFRYRVYRSEDQRAERRLAATMLHTCVFSEIAGPTKMPFPPDIKAILEQHYKL